MTVAIYCVWDCELLRQSIDNIKKCVDEVVVVYSNYSNYNNFMMFDKEQFQDCRLVNWEPSRTKTPYDNETAKRNEGLEVARKMGAKYFIMMDADEFYNPMNFIRWLMYLRLSNLNGLVCRSRVYFKQPTLMCEDHTLVTFIHRMQPGLKFGKNVKYPHARDVSGLRIDPTRQLSINEGVELVGEYMDHYSWVRKDYPTKIYNSTARNNILKSTVMEDLKNAKPGYLCKFYRSSLKEVPNHYNISL